MNTSTIKKMQDGHDSLWGAFMRAGLSLLILVLCGVWMASLDGLAASPSTGPQTNLPLGLITSKAGDKIFITPMTGAQLSRTAQQYSLDPQVTITDENGRVRDQSFLKPGVWIKFHLKQQRIDQLVLIRPK